MVDAQKIGGQRTKRDQEIHVQGPVSESPECTVQEWPSRVEQDRRAEKKGGELQHSFGPRFDPLEKARIETEAHDHELHGEE